MASRNIDRKLINSRLLKNYGSWLYCTVCNKTVAYICYTTYKGLKISYACKCGIHGEVELIENTYSIPNVSENEKSLIQIDNRFCCPNDKDPIFSVVSKRLENYEYKITCLKCNGTFIGKG